MWCSQAMLRKCVFRLPFYTSLRLHVTLYGRCRSYMTTICNSPSLISVEPRNKGLPEQAARTRFAPSPTGYLHLGSLRTALYNYLLARATKGQFILRLEDTDQSRIVSDAEERLYKDLEWAGISWDEGPDCGGLFGPYKQSSRLQIYRDHAAQLLAQGKAFRCFCSHNDLAAHNRRSLEVDGIFGGYPGRCLSISGSESAERASKGEPYTVRFNSDNIPAEVDDMVYGVLQKKIPEDHFIIVKSDGYPTYHFANVVDDHLMKITHVIRGAEWLVSTSKHISLYRAFGWEPPKFGHVGLLVNSKRQKLSKRSMDIGIDSYRRDGVLPPALLNFVALLGWNPQNIKTNGVMTLDQMTENFGLKFTRGDIVVDTGKLHFFNKKHFQLAVESLPSNSRFMDKILVDPILKRVSEIEEQRRQLKNEAAQAAAQPENPLLFLGDPIIGLGEIDRNVSRHIIYSMLKMARVDCVTASEVVDANKFLLWEPSPFYILNSFRKINTRNADGHSCTQRCELSDVSDLLQLFITAIENIDVSQWTHDNIRGVLSDTVTKITRQSKEQITKAVVYSYLRWAFLGLMNGPQMSFLVKFLGKKETQRRLRLAKAIVNAESTEVPM